MIRSTIKNHKSATYSLSFTRQSAPVDQAGISIPIGACLKGQSKHCSAFPCASRSNDIPSPLIYMDKPTHKRVFDIDIETFSECGGDVKIIASIENPTVIQNILAHLDGNVSSPATALLPDCRASPTMQINKQDSFFGRRSAEHGCRPGTCLLISVLFKSGLFFHCFSGLDFLKHHGRI